MNLRQVLFSTAAAIGIAAMAVAVPAPAGAQQAAVQIDNDDIGGVVTGANGPEAGVWVIAETTELPTKYAKIVVTDDQGRYVIPDLPNANYQVWGARLWAGGLADVARQTRPADQSHDGAGAQRAGGGAVLSGDLLVRDDENSAGERFWRLDRDPEKHHTRDLAPAHG